MSARVLIVQESLPQYRVPLFTRLRDRLASSGIELDVAHGQPDADVGARQDGGQLAWSTELENRRLRVNGNGRSVVWQPIYRRSAGYDLLIVEQASRLLVNYALLARQQVGGSKIAIWGHGDARRDDLSPVDRFARSARSAISRLPHWWFAYTDGGARRVAALGFPAERITVVQNAVDTSWTSPGDARVRQPDRCVFLGSLYAEKRLDFLIEAGDRIARQRPSFELAIVGDGPQRHRVVRWAVDRPYLRYCGALFGAAKAAELATASLVLNPGRVGLGVLDAFAAGTPMVTTDGPFHSPEVEYLRHAENGWMTANDIDAYAAAVTQLLDHPVQVSRLRIKCQQDSARFSLTEMVDRFAVGITAASAVPGHRLRTVS